MLFNLGSIVDLNTVLNDVLQTFRSQYSEGASQALPGKERPEVRCEGGRARKRKQSSGLKRKKPRQQGIQTAEKVCMPGLSLRILEKITLFTWGHMEDRR